MYSPDSSPFSSITDLIPEGRKERADSIISQLPPLANTSKHNDLIASHPKAPLGLGRTTGLRSLSARTTSRSKRHRTSQVTTHSKQISFPNSEGSHTTLQGKGTEGQKFKGVNRILHLLSGQLWGIPQPGSLQRTWVPLTISSLLPTGFHLQCFY